MLIWPKPDMISDWKQWARLLIQVLQKQGGGGAGGGVIDVVTSANSIVDAGVAVFSNLSGGECIVPSRVIAAGSLVLLTPQTEPLGRLWEDTSVRVAGRDFTIRSTDQDDEPTVAWAIVKP